MINKIEKLLKDHELVYEKSDLTNVFTLKYKNITWYIQYDDHEIEYCWIELEDELSDKNLDLIFEENTFEFFESEFVEILKDVKNYAIFIVKLKKEINKIKELIINSNVHGLKMSNMLLDLLPTDLFK